MTLLYIIYVIFLIVLSPRMVSNTGTGCLGYFFFIALCMVFPFFGSIIWAYIVAPVGRGRSIFEAIASHVLLAAILLVVFLDK